MEAAWIKNYGDDLYLQCTYTCIRTLDRGLGHACKNDIVRRHQSGRDETTPYIQRRLRHRRRTALRNMRQYRSRRCRRSRQHEFVHEHRFIRTADIPNRTFTIKKMWINTDFDNLRRLRANIKL
uniref:Capsid protein n=1 Tax=Angiostrongylus cantonensis TaxID=6313 RepID=A0A0K0DKL2_ANGCA